ncbi:hypothetical protein [Micrococcus sp.]|uniref:hypothetical protein n=1 Tax=Micrococcus sp. TaxID=1271 RepID=UPI002A91C30D|nr:hypothetical protein [Micrococcus sp.]MDY6054284.1 hypothetical protein [Micrococcus sp.]
MTGPDLLGALAAGLDPAAPASRLPHAAPTGDAVICSRRGCRAEAFWALEWNNPRVHTPERVKTWTACPAHRNHLEDFLASRGFLRRTRPLHPPTPAQEDRP